MAPTKVVPRLPMRNWNYISFLLEEEKEESTKTTYEELKLMLIGVTIANFKYQDYLWGIETNRFDDEDLEALYGYQDYLWGIETKIQRRSNEIYNVPRLPMRNWNQARAREVFGDNVSTKTTYEELKQINGEYRDFTIFKVPRLPMRNWNLTKGEGNIDELESTKTTYEELKLLATRVRMGSYKYQDYLWGIETKIWRCSWPIGGHRTKTTYEELKLRNRA